MICFGLLFLLRQKEKDWLAALAETVILWNCILLPVCYGWSALKRLTAGSIAGTYLVIDLILLFVIVLRRKKGLLLWHKKEPITGILGRAGLCGLFLIVLYYAVKCVPYNWDSMTYHLARITNWAQNRSVFPYATHIERQIASPVLGAYINLMVYLLGGAKDNLLNLLQCVSFGMNALFVYGITSKLGVDKKVALLAPLFYLCMPIALAEATTTQVDNFAALWALIFVYLMLELADAEKKLEWNRETGERVIFAALSIGFGYLAKPSVCFAIVIFLVWLLFVCIRRKTSFCVIIRYIIIAIPAAAVVILPNFIVQMAAFGSAFHSGVGQRQLIGTLNPKYMLLNFLKNFTFNLASAEVETTRILIEKFLYGAADILHIDLNDPAISEDGVVFAFPDFPALNCDTALNMFLLVTALLLAVYFILNRKKQSQMVRGFSVYAVSSFLIFCCFLRWEKYISRYMITYLAFLSVFIVVQIYDMIRRIRKSSVCYGICAALVLGCLVNFYNEIMYLRSTAPFDRPDSYFTYNPEMKDEYVSILGQIQAGNGKKIGLVIRSDSFEYPIWEMLGDEYEIRHIMVNGALGKFEEEGYVPDYIIYERGTDESVVYAGNTYSLEMTGDKERLALYKICEKGVKQK